MSSAQNSGSSSLPVRDTGSSAPLRFLCCFLAISVPFVSFLIYNDYGVFRFELAGIFLFFGVLAAVCWVFTLYPSRILTALIFGLIVVLFCDLAFIDFLKRDSLLLSLGILLSVFIVAFLVAVFLAKACWQALAAFLFVYLVSAFLFPEQRSPAAAQSSPADTAGRTDLPPVVHLILDEHLGLDGFPNEIAESAAVRAEILSFYERWGFRLYSQAFSEEFATKHSLRRVFSGQSGPVLPNSGEKSSGGGATLLKELEERGYRFLVAGISHADLCKTTGLKQTDCRNYDLLSINNLEEANLSPFQKALLIAGGHLKQSTIYKLVLNAEILAVKQLRQMDIEASLLDVEAYSLSTLSSDRQLQRIRAEVPKIEAGQYHLHHLILPHFPYALKSNCDLRDVREWQNYDDLVTDDFNTPASRRDKYGLYFTQLQCLYLRLEHFMRALHDEGMLDETILLLHGDHGSRISLHQPPATAKSHLTIADLVDSYSTLFAVRAPQVAPGFDRTRISIQKLYSALAANGFGPGFEARVEAAALRDAPQINLRGSPEHRWMEMPAFGDVWHRPAGSAQSK